MRPNERTTTPLATRINIPEASREQVAAELNKVLATLSDLHAQTKFAHWNVRGPNFIALHKLFDELAELVEELVDEVAERVTALGGVAQGTLRSAEEHSDLDDFPDGVFDGMEVVAGLSERYGQAGNACRGGIDLADEVEDVGTVDLLTVAGRKLDQALYFLDAHLR